MATFIRTTSREPRANRSVPIVHPVTVTRRVRRRRLRLAGVLTASLLTLVATVSGPAGATVRAFATSAYREPVVGGVIVEHFHAPPTPYGAGNRGVDERVRALTPVVASAAGVVLFAGQVGGSLHVTVGHADGFRTSYSFLAAVVVHRGERVEQGTPLGLSAELVHFGVRDSFGAYLDPEALWAGRLGAHLVVGPEEGATDRTSRSSPEPPATAMADEARILVTAVSEHRFGSQTDRIAVLVLDFVAQRWRGRLPGPPVGREVTESVHSLVRPGNSP